jgi:hypothetical protein
VDYIKMDLGEIGLIWLRTETVEDSREHSNAPSGSIEGWEVFEFPIGSF